MKIIQRYGCLLLLLMAASANAQHRIVVDINGNGDYQSIQAAISSLPDTAAITRVIYIKKGVYKEKLYIEKANITLMGEDREKVMITAATARDEWRCGHPDDWGVATLNAGASDITLRNLTLINSYGFDFVPKTIYCATDTTANKMKSVRKDGHQMALRTMNGATRLKAVNCRFAAFGGDTVSPWDVDNGLWYFKDCIMEGGVDFYCPRGWAWAENCTFITHTGTAAIWHDGSKYEDSKTVLVNCIFKGYDGFMLGRYHRDAQFYLLHCSFADNMRDTAIYRVPTTNAIKWGHRVYYYNCHRKAGDYKWFADNITSQEAANVTAGWLFGARWRPDENEMIENKKAN